MGSNKRKDEDEDSKGDSGQDMESIELKEKAKNENDKLDDGVGEKMELPHSPKSASDKDSPISKAFFFSKYITFW